ncbi:hypothetical protein SEA_GUUELAD_107 [Mycobacterium phage GuuelaD]|uniref:Uncharacterized protein n=1 Tax=Mycobacterium phage GuuelaD TaxID=2015819 RepID=A0A286MQL3_9CAUD|nr:hypothetical protein J4T97_gp126 [Mycobacterium phage GuuelaD]ASW31538.1 hypothetical protein SEA_GUUELAD_107 [Mycobacterium phage GuuelaD]
MSDQTCSRCGYERYAHSPFHDGHCIADEPFDGDYACECTEFVSGWTRLIESGQGPDGQLID